MSNGREAGNRQMALRLLDAALALQSPSVTLSIVSAVLAGNPVPSTDSALFAKVLDHLAHLAKHEDHADAMIVLAKFLATQRQSTEALRWFEKALDRPIADIKDASLASHALVEIARSLVAHGKVSEARTRLRHAVDEMNLDGPAYFYLGTLEEPKSSAQEDCFSIAAALGVAEAAHNMGLCELARAHTAADSNAYARERATLLAGEWFSVAAEAGYHPSILNLAILSRTLGHDDDAHAWLLKAEAKAEATEAKARLAARSPASVTQTRTMQAEARELRREVARLRQEWKRVVESNK